MKLKIEYEINQEVLKFKTSIYKNYLNIELTCKYNMILRIKYEVKKLNEIKLENENQQCLITYKLNKLVNIISY